MIDIDTNKIIDLLDSREIDAVTNWLKTYPNIKIVSRDGSIIYATAIRKAHPNAIQISDRFHLLKNLTEYCKSYITKNMSFKIKIPHLLCNPTGIITRKSQRIKQAQHLYSIGMTQSEISIELKMDIRTVKKYISLKADDLDFKDNDSQKIKHEENVSKKEKNIELVRKLHKEGYRIKEISIETGISRQAIRRYLKPDASPVHGTYGSSKKSLLTPFHTIIDELVTKGYTFKKIEEFIRDNGYTGAASTIRMYTTRKRRLIKQVVESSISKFHLIDRKNIIKLLYKPIEQIKELSVNELERVLNGLYLWIEDARQLNISEVNSFINGVINDIDGVRHAILYPHSNGLAEGSVNKLKVIKRIMYGRCSFDTFRRKVLLLEKFRDFN